MVRKLKNILSVSRFFVVLEFEVRYFLNSIGSVIGKIFIEPIVYFLFVLYKLIGYIV